MTPHSRRRWVAGRIMLLPLVVVAIHSTQTVPRGPAPQRIEGWVPMRRRRDGRTCVEFQLSGLRSPAQMDTERTPGTGGTVFSKIRNTGIRLTGTYVTGRNCKARSVWDNMARFQHKRPRASRTQPTDGPMRRKEGALARWSSSTFQQRRATVFQDGQQSVFNSI